jgi:putative RNA 2'-phosphotransferase
MAYMNKNNIVKKGKKLAYWLRHKPEAANLTMDKHGWVPVQELIRNTNVSATELDEIVETNNKKRYSFNESKTKIRANQGHSVDIDLELEAIIPPDVLYHGTATRTKDVIMKEGLKGMSRKHVHLSLDVDTAKVVSKRHSDNTVILNIDAKGMNDDGYNFYCSANNVWLADEVPPKYITVSTYS